AEDDEQDERQHEGDQDAARIADHLQALLAHEGSKAARPTGWWRGFFRPDKRFRAHAASARSEFLTSSMKASSIVGSGFSGLATLALSSSGEPRAIERPR